jgi:DNA-binding LytR/AlgR family response regulator
MKVILIEDEALAAKRLQNMLTEIDPAIQVIKVIDSIEEAVEWFSTYPHPDLIFMDIMLADGQSFEIFEQVEIKAPVIFTTAYDEYAIKAFKVNSVDYLLKPVETVLLTGALDKFRANAGAQGNLKQMVESLMASNYKSQEVVSEFKKRFLIKTGDKFIPVSIAEVAYFSFTDKLTFLTTNGQKRYMLDHTLDELEKLVDPHVFFRLNRQYIAAFSSIKVVHNYFNGKLKVMVTPEIPEGIIVSKERAQVFKSWLSR